MADAAPVKVLFVCSHNKWRSTTGEAVFSRVAGVSARSAGTAPDARHPVTVADIRWADLIFVMEDQHEQRLHADFGQDVTGKTLHVLDIPDDYQFMDEALVALLRERCDPLIFGAA
tara:strand:- start:189 stop:536 length:348 start_codon:yes stop_codon:yes gene_type:complete